MEGTLEGAASDQCARACDCFRYSCSGCCSCFLLALHTQGSLKAKNGHNTQKLRIKKKNTMEKIPPVEVIFKRIQGSSGKKKCLGEIRSLALHSRS